MTLNVRERQVEIGTLRALGYGSGTIASLFIGKAVLIGVVGALIGFAGGAALAGSFGPEIFKIPSTAFRVQWMLLPIAAVAASVACALASLVPAMLAVTRDPAEVLRGE